MRCATESICARCLHDTWTAPSSAEVVPYAHAIWQPKDNSRGTSVIAERWRCRHNQAVLPSAGTPRRVYSVPRLKRLNKVSARSASGETATSLSQCVFDPTIDHC